MDFSFEIFNFSSICKLSGLNFTYKKSYVNLSALLKIVFKIPLNKNLDLILSQ